jgi:midasin (ATPase involved in ribosome maturation)
MAHVHTRDATERPSTTTRNSCQLQTSSIRQKELATGANSKPAPVARKKKRRLELQVELVGEWVDALEQHVQDYLILILILILTER